MSRTTLYTAPLNTPAPLTKAALTEAWNEANGAQLEPWQRNLIRTWGLRTEQQYIKDRINTRLQGNDPGPYETNRMKR